MLICTRMLLHVCITYKHICSLPCQFTVKFLLNVPACLRFISGHEERRCSIFHTWAKILSGRGKSLGTDVVMAIGLKGEKLAGEKRNFREKDQIKVFSCAFLHKEKIAEALICSNPGGCSVPGERRGVQCSRRWASLNVSASCNTSPETLGAPSTAVQGDALMSITVNVIALDSLSQMRFKARDFVSQRKPLEKRTNVLNQLPLRAVCISPVVKYF